MTILKASEVRKLELKAIAEKEHDLKKELMKLKTQVASGSPPESPGKIRAIKRALATINTIKRERGEI